MGIDRHARRVAGAFAVLFLLAPAVAPATDITMKDGRILRGKLALLSSLSDVNTAPGGEVGVQPIVLLDDDLRRTFVPKFQVAAMQDGRPPLEEKFNVRQRVLKQGQTVKSVGPPLKIDPFDEYGRRIYAFATAKGKVDVIQGITDLTPTFAKVEGVSHVWDMRIATSSIPPNVLRKILMRQIDAKDPEQQKRLVRFYLQAERFEEARDHLQWMFQQFPNPELKQQLEPTLVSLQQLAAQRLLDELKLRGQAGQHALVRQKLGAFPADNVAGEILQAVREMTEAYQRYDQRRSETLARLDVELEKLTEPALKAKLAPIREEIGRELDMETIARFAAFRQNADDVNLLPPEKLALAVSGWLLGSDQAVVKLPVALSAYKTRELVKQYLNEPIKIHRERILQYLKAEEAAVPGMVTAMLASMKPPVAPPDPLDEKTPGYYKLQVAGLPKEPPINYYVQLPPEYNPYRKYPTIVTLNGAGTTAVQQIDWWAGAWAGQDSRAPFRAGQATRNGYIVIAPEWTTEHQKQYGYSAHEHMAVLNALRDAARRFAIDTDRVFLSGHSIGGDAAWDIGLAHPDLWAGVIPIVAQSDKYVALYTKNAERVPLYFVAGEFDGGKMARNARELNRYFIVRYNVTVVEYLGRGHEHFHDEILRLFDWMGRFRREFFPREIDARTMRPWDNYFWWIELSGMPPNSMVDPADWPKRGAHAVELTAKINKAEGINVRAGSSHVTLWLSPRMLDFTQRTNIVINGRRFNSGNRFVEPELPVLLEDVRTRGDRFNPFWAKIETATGRTKEM